MTAVSRGISISTKDDDILSKVQRSFDAQMDIPNPPHRFEIEHIMSHIFPNKDEVIHATEATAAISFATDKCGGLSQRRVVYRVASEQSHIQPHLSPK